jgi:hypothetical protein
VLDLVMSAGATEELAPPTPATPGAPGDPVPRVGMAPLEPSAPLVPSVRVGAFGSEAPSSTSGSTNSTEANSSVGISPESGLASRTGGALEAGELAALEVAASVSGSKSSSTPYASRSSSESIAPFDGAVGGDTLVGAGAAEEEGPAPPAFDAVPFNPKGSSTGRSAKGSKAGREAASIVFEPELGDQSKTYPAVPPPRYLGAGSQIGGPAVGS